MLSGLNLNRNTGLGGFSKKKEKQKSSAKALVTGRNCFKFTDNCSNHSDTEQLYKEHKNISGQQLQ